MLISTILLGSLAVVFSPLQVRAFTVPAACVDRCPADASAIGTACLAFVNGDNSQKEGCRQGCVVTKQQAAIEIGMQSCRDCVWGIDSVLAGELERGHTVVCLGGSLPSTTASRSASASTGTGVSTVSATASQNATAAATSSAAANETQKDNGASPFAPAQAVVMLGLVAAML